MAAHNGERCHCIFQNWPIIRPSKSARPHPSLKTHEYHKSQLYYCSANLTHIGRTNIHYEMTITTIRTVLQLLGTHSLGEQCKLSSLLYCSCSKAPTTSSQPVARIMLKHTFSQRPINADQNVESVTQISLIATLFLPYQHVCDSLNKRFSFFTKVFDINPGTWSKSSTRIQVVQ